MQVGSLKVQLVRKHEEAKLVVCGPLSGIEGTVTVEELERLARFLNDEARTWRASRAPDYYAILGISRDASAQEIQQAYRTRAKVSHPDTSGHETGAAMTLVNEAYAVLGDPQRRQTYDTMATH